MERVYYVQRLKKPHDNINPFSFGGGLVNGGISKEGMGMLKGIMSFDYMGSSEFEWGAVPTALQALASEGIKAAINTIICNEQEVYIIAPEAVMAEVTEWVTNTAKGEHEQLKESLNFKRALDKEKYADAVGWLKIEDDRRCDEPFMFFIDKQMFENVCKLFGIAYLRDNRV